MNRGRRPGSRQHSMNPRQPPPPMSAMARNAIATGRRYYFDGPMISLNEHPRQPTVEEVRRSLQEKYNNEAQEAAEKQRQQQFYNAQQPGCSNAQQPERSNIQYRSVSTRPIPIIGGINQTAVHFLGSGYNGAASNSIPGTAANVRPAPAGSAAVAVPGHVLGFSAATTSTSDGAQPDPRQQMLAARARLQAQYNQLVIASAQEAEGQVAVADTTMPGSF